MVKFIADGIDELAMKDILAGKGRMRFVNPIKSDDVHLSEWSWVLFHEDVVGLQKVPHGGLDFAKQNLGADFETYDNALIPFFSNSSFKDKKAPLKGKPFYVLDSDEINNVTT